ncbi:MAG: AraC family transcriptional regulator [Myxococcales bacterium]
MQVSLFLFRGLCAHLRDQGVSRERLLSEAGLSADHLEQTPGYVSGETMRLATAAAYRLTNDPALGLSLGTHVPPQMVSAVGSLFVQCATLREALTEVQRYMPLIATGGHFTLQEDGLQARLVYHPPNFEADARVTPEYASEQVRFAVELCFALMLNAARVFLGRKIGPLRVRLPYTRPAHVEAYDELFACPLEFSTDTAELVFDRSFLDREQLFTNVRLHRLLKEQAESMLLSEVRSEPLHLRVRAILREEELTLGEKGRQMLAKRLGLSARSLRRRLSQEGQTLWNLLEDARKDHAFFLLSETDTPLKNIAERLGFSEPSAFHRAFKRWTSQTPIQYRLDHRTARAPVAC